METPKYNTPLHIVRAKAYELGNDTTFSNKGVLTVFEKSKTTKMQFSPVHGVWFFKCSILDR